MSQLIGSNFVQCGNNPSNLGTYRRILAQYIDTALAPTPPQDLASVLAVGNSTGGLSIDASGIGGTAIDATGSDILAQNLNVEKITPLGAPVVTNVTLDGGLTLQTGGAYRVEFEDEIRIGKGVTDFIYTDPTDGLHLENAPDVYVDNLHYNTLTPAPPAPINYQTYYANLGDDLQSALIPLATGTRNVLVLSTGSWSYGATLNFQGDTCIVEGQDSFSPLTRITSTGGFLLDGASSTRYQFRNIAFNGIFQLDGTQGRHRFEEVEFLSGLLITGATSNFLSFNNCEFSGGSITIPGTFAGSITFVNCNFNGTVAINLNQSLATQVVFTNCINLPAVNEAKCTILGNNQINSIPRSDVLVTNYKLGANTVSLGIDLTGGYAGALRCDGTNITSPTSGSVSGNHLKIIINGTPYKIELKNV